MNYVRVKSKLKVPRCVAVIINHCLCFPFVLVGKLSASGTACNLARRRRGGARRRYGIWSTLEAQFTMRVLVLSCMQIGHVWLIRYCQPCYEIAEVPSVYKNEFKMSSTFLRETLNRDLYGTC